MRILPTAGGTIGSGKVSGASASAATERSASATEQMRFDAFVETVLGSRYQPISTPPLAVTNGDEAFERFLDVVLQRNAPVQPVSEGSQRSSDELFQSFLEQVLGPRAPAQLVSPDFTSSNDALSYATGELNAALAGGSPDVILLDACEQATYEVAASAWRSGANQLVASERTVPQASMPYGDWFSRIAQASRGGAPLTDELVASTMVDAYASVPDPGYAAMARINLERFPQLEEAVEAFSKALIAAGGCNANPAIRTCYDRSFRPYLDAEINAIDLGDFAKEISAAFPASALGEAADAVSAAVSASCLVKSSDADRNDERATGLTIAAPNNHDLVPPDYRDPRSAWDKSSWISFIETVA